MLSFHLPWPRRVWGRWSRVECPKDRQYSSLPWQTCDKRTQTISWLFWAQESPVLFVCFTYFDLCGAAMNLWVGIVQGGNDKCWEIFSEMTFASNLKPDDIFKREPTNKNRFRDLKEILLFWKKNIFYADSSRCSVSRTISMKKGLSLVSWLVYRAIASHPLSLFSFPQPLLSFRTKFVNVQYMVNFEPWSTSFSL